MGKELDVDAAVVHRSVARLKKARLLDEDRNVNRHAVEEFLIHAVPYLAPVEPGPLVRGMPTAWAAKPLSEIIAASGDPPPVWPDSQGKVRGQSVEPLSDRAVALSQDDPALHIWFSLIDGIRIGRTREKELAAEEISRRIWAERTSPA